LKIVFLASASADLRWFQRYYGDIFPEGRARAGRQLQSAKTVIKQNPMIGHAIETRELREFLIPRTPFSLIYRVTIHRIEVVRVWDARGDRSTI
jgi:plasmid stabilization system protein ParE